VSAKVNSLRISSHGSDSRTATIEIATGYTRMRADINDLPQDMFDVLKEWVDSKQVSDE